MYSLSVNTPVEIDCTFIPICQQIFGFVFFHQLGGVPEKKHRPFKRFFTYRNIRIAEDEWNIEKLRIMFLFHQIRQTLASDDECTASTFILIYGTF